MTLGLGVSAKLYRNTASYGSPSWSALDLVSDLSVKPSWDKAEGSTRSSRAKVYAKTLLDIEVSGKIRFDLTDAGYTALANALNSDTPLDLLILTGLYTTNGNRGFRADWHVFADEEDQGLGVIIFDSFTLAPAVSANLPYSVLVSGGGPVYTLAGAGA